MGEDPTRDRMRRVVRRPAKEISDMAQAQVGASDVELEKAGIRYEEPAEHVARIVLARPEARNAQDKPMLYALNAAFDRAAHDDSVKVIVLAADRAMYAAKHAGRNCARVFRAKARAA